MYLMVTVYYPNDQGEAVLNKYVEVMGKYPPDESIGTVVLPASGRGTKDGMEVHTISEINKGKLDEAMIRVGKMLHEYRGIPGYRYETKTLMTAEEAMEINGMKG